jgi:hypothetical protein
VLSDDMNFVNIYLNRQGGGFFAPAGLNLLIICCGDAGNLEASPAMGSHHRDAPTAELALLGCYCF